MPVNIPYSQAFVSGCQAQLAAAFGNTDFRLTMPSQPKPQGVRITLEDTGKTGNSGAEQDEGFPTLFVAPIRVEGVKPSHFYFSFVATFDPWVTKNKKHILNHVSVTVFQKMPWGGVTPCFRADWHAAIVEHEASKHAQPHWHFVQDPSAIENAVATLLRAGPVEFSARSPDMFSDTVDIRGVHFAMSPLWSNSLTETRKQLYQDREQFGKWFQCLTTYIAEQLIYACKKHPSVASQSTFGEQVAEQHKLDDFK